MRPQVAAVNAVVIINIRAIYSSNGRFYFSGTYRDQGRMGTSY
jgi:hypothetical protein